MFITFEGIEKSGKTTQSNILLKRLEAEDFKVILLREPGGTQISEKIRNILLDPVNTEMFQSTEFLLYSASRAQLVNQVILPAVRNNVIVICDRFYDSSTAYQGFGRGIDLSIIELINGFAAGIKPDISFFIDVDVVESKHRQSNQSISEDRLEKSDSFFFNNVRKGFFSIAEKEPMRMKILDGKLSIDVLANQIWDTVSEKINLFNKHQ
jgi:dTMP kinase